MSRHRKESPPRLGFGGYVLVVTAITALVFVAIALAGCSVSVNGKPSSDAPAIPHATAVAEPTTSDLASWFQGVSADYDYWAHAEQSVERAARSGDATLVQIRCNDLANAVEALQDDPQPPPGRFANQWSAALNDELLSARFCVAGDFRSAAVAQGRSNRELNRATAILKGSN